MTIAIVGGTGFLGSAIARALVARNAPVVQVARGSAGRAPVPGARFAAADRTDRDALCTIFRDHGVVCVIDVLTLTLDHTRPLLEAAATSGARYVMISAIDVTANYGGLARMETPAPLLRPTREDDPRRSVLYPYRTVARLPAGFDPAIMRDYDKIPIEDAARADARLGALILRLPAIWGPGDMQGRFSWLFGALRTDGRIEIDARAAAWEQSFVHIDEAADAVARAALSNAAGETFNIATDRTATMRDWAERAVAACAPGTIVTTAPPGTRALLSDRAEATDMTYPLTLDGSRFAARFGPVACVDEAAALRAARDWDDAVAARA